MEFHEQFQSLCNRLISKVLTANKSTINDENMVNSRIAMDIGSVSRRYKTEQYNM